VNFNIIFASGSGFQLFPSVSEHWSFKLANLRTIPLFKGRITAGCFIAASRTDLKTFS